MILKAKLSSIYTCVWLYVLVWHVQKYEYILNIKKRLRHSKAF